MPRHWLTIALLAALFAAGVMLFNSSPDVLQLDAPQAGREGDLQLTSYLTGVATTQYNELGSVDYNFTAEQMSYFQVDSDTTSADDYTAISRPFFTINREEGEPWYLQSRQGRSTQNGETVVLTGDVRVWRDDENDRPIIITTSELIIRPEIQLAESDQSVTITHPRSVSHGTGMRADLQHETFSILSEGSTTYEPNP